MMPQPGKQILPISQVVKKSDNEIFSSKFMQKMSKKN